VTVFDHLEDGMHGTGDPAEAVRNMRKILDRLREMPERRSVDPDVPTAMRELGWSDARMWVMEIINGER